MAKQTINIGSGELQGDGESIRSAFDKINQNFDELYNNLGSDGSSSDRLTASGDEVILTGGANPYTTFPAITGGDQLLIQGAEIASISGNLAVTSRRGLNVISNTEGLGQGGSFGWIFNAQGDIELPIKFPVQFTAVFDEAHYNGGGTFQGDGTISLGVQLQGLGAQFQWLVNDPTFDTDRGYVGQQAFRYTEADHGITGVNVDILVEVMGPDLETGLYSLQIAFSPAPGPADLAKIRSTDELIISSGTKGWIFDVNGDIYLPAGGDIVDSTGTSVLGGGSISVLDEFDIETSNVTAFAFSSGFNISSPEPGLVTVELTGDGLPTVTVPGETGTTYKGLQVSYGMVHSNSSNTELNVNKIVIHKPAQTTTEIDPTSSQDYFRVSGLGDSDVLAMFVIFGDVNGAKPLSDLQTFAQAAIDNVILTNGVEGNYNTVENMRVAFYENYATLASAANGLDLDFEFYNNSTPVNTGTTAVLEGSGAIFDIADAGDGTYNNAGVQNAGTNYQAGHKIKILGTALGGATPDNDCIVTVVSTAGSGEIFQWSVSGTAAGTGYALYGAVTGTNIDVGSGFDVSQIYFNGVGAFDYFGTNSQGSNYVVGDVLTLLGSGIVGGSSPTNDITITVTAVDGGGGITATTATGEFPRVWPENSISDGGNDQYDTANYINSFYAANIQYNSGNTVADGAAAFGAGSSYTFVYDTGIFGLLVTGNSSTFIETSGNSGADGSSITEAGNIFGPDIAEQTFDNAVTHINLIGDPYAGPIVSFTKTDNGNEVDILIPDDGNGAGVGITRDGNSGIYNPYREGEWDSEVSPGGTLWNIDGWEDFGDVESRTYAPLYETFGFGGLGNKIVGAECVMYLPDNDKYYAVKFSAWTQNNNGGGFAYTRRELDLTSLSEGIRFPDGTRLKSAEGLGRVKLQSPGNRRIEEAHGYKSVTVTAVTPGVTQTAVIRQSSENWDFYVNATPELNQLYNNQGTFNYLEFSFDAEQTWIKVGFGGGQPDVYYQMVFEDNVNRPVTADTIVDYRVVTGGTPVVWWDMNDLPSGGGNFRGAVIDYHAYSGEATWIGTIHIVRDSGEEHISHSEVGSGTTDSENDDLWLVQNEGTISYRRIDGEGKTLKVQWTAKVFYGSEFYD